MRNILILGATSAIAQATARILAERGDRLFLVGRNAEKLKQVAEDLGARGAAEVITGVLDFANLEEHQQILSEVYDQFSPLDVVLIAYGSLGDQKACERNFSLAEYEFNTNFLSVCALLNELARHFEQQKKGVLAVISSVAGDRGRQSNYIYGAAKGGLSIYLQGLRNRLQPAGVQVVTIKPGFVDTPMTAHLDQGPLYVAPDVVARGIVKAMEKKKNVVYLPWFWRWIMLIIKSIPEPIFKRLKL